MAESSNNGRKRKHVHSDAPHCSVSDSVEANIVQAVASDKEVGLHLYPVSDSVEANVVQAVASDKEVGLHLYPVSCKTQSGEKIKLQLNPGYSVMDIRTILLDSPETCFFTCYDLLLNTKDGLIDNLEDFNTISEVADITIGECSLEMVSALYNDRSMRTHVHRTRELLSLSTLSTSLESTGDAIIKNEVPELDGLGFMEDLTSFSNLLSSPSNEFKCVESIVVSTFNPAPSYRRLVGDLIYLDVVTLEGNEFCITGSTKGFYVNSSSVNNTLSPEPCKTYPGATTLVGLLQNISSEFQKAFCRIVKRAFRLENRQSLLPPNSWLGLHPVPDHKRDATRAEAGSELIGMRRDWNEEVQSCRELPRTTSQERILRDRALYKVTSDFVVAAISGATAVMSRCIPPLYPTDPECFHMYVHDNIFFSFAVDADLELLSRYSTSKMGSTAETQFRTQRATYASANNDLNGTKAYQEADVPGLCNLASAIIDYRGHRVIAQSVIPGILHGNLSYSVVYGSANNGKKIRSNEVFHLKMVEAAKRLHLKEHTVVDKSKNVCKLAAAVDCKGIVGTDDRFYLLDLMRVTPHDANFGESASRFCILRPELLASYCQVHDAEKSKFKSNCEGEAQVTTDGPEPNVFNPNVFTGFQIAGSVEEIQIDEENVRKLGCYLIKVVQKFIEDMCSNKISPMDGQTLTEALHDHGINVRYVGKVADGTRHLPHLWDLCSNEIVVRSAKHILKDVLRDTEDHDIGPAICHFFNCLFGSYKAVGSKVTANSSESRTSIEEQAGYQSSAKRSRRQGSWKGEASMKNNVSSYMGVSSETLWSDIQEFAKLKYKFKLAEDASTCVKKYAVVRNLCQKVGITIAARRYDLNSAAPFEAADILNLQPVVKHSVPICLEAKDLVKAGKIQWAERKLTKACTSFSKALSILEQVTGPMHREVAYCCRYLAMVMYDAGRKAEAIKELKKELIISERCLGLDHPGTGHSYGNMALINYELGQTELSLRLMSRALFLLSASSGGDHPDVAATLLNMAVMYQDLLKTDTVIQCLQEALTMKERLLGKKDIQPVVCHHKVARAFRCMSAFELYHHHEKETYDILAEQLGEEDTRTRYSQSWMKKFKELQEQLVNAQNAQSAEEAIDIEKMNAQNAQSAEEAINIEKMNAQNAQSAEEAIDVEKMNAQNAQSSEEASNIEKADPDLQALQSAAIASGSGSSNASVNRSLN